jgi:hypothetical protein
MKKIIVCSSCLCSTCWQGLFMCQDSLNADIKEISVDEALKLGKEHPSYIHKYSYEKNNA